MIIASFTYAKPSGLRTVHDQIVHRLRCRGYTIVSHYGDVSMPGIDVHGFRHIEAKNIVGFTTWHLGNLSTAALAISPLPFLWIPFVEGIPIVTDLAREAINSKHVIVAPTNYVKTMLEKVGIRVRKVVPPYIDVRLAVPDPILVRMVRSYFRDCRAVLSYVAAYYPRKAIDRVLEAVDRAAELYGTELGFILLTNRAPSYRPKNVRLWLDTSLGSAGDATIASYIAASDVYIHLSFSEGLGIPMIIAQYLGKPLVIPNAEPFTEVCRGVCITVDIEKVTYEEWIGEELVENKVWSLDHAAQRIIEAIELAPTVDKDEVRRRAQIKYMNIVNIDVIDRILKEMK